MLFSGIPFLFYFLPAVLMLYFAAPAKAKNYVLLFSSLVFYGWGEPKYVVLMIISIIVGYVSACLLEIQKNLVTKRIILTGSLVILLGFLGYFKYVDFFIGNFNAVTGMSVPFLRELQLSVYFKEHH